MRQRTQPEVLTDLIFALSQASGAASQIIHALQDPRFIQIRDTIELTREGCIALAPRNLMVAPRKEKSILL